MQDRLAAQNKPNPFSKSTTIEFTMPTAGEVSVVIYNLNGVPVKYLVNDSRDAGTYQIVWDGSGESGVKLPKGVYFYTFAANKNLVSKKMIYN